MICERSAQLREHRHLVVQTARRLMRRLPPNAVAMDELMQAGMIGLNEAMSGYVERGATFGTYASRRIEGAMLDELRSQDKLPRELRAQHNKVRNAVHKLEHKLGRAPRAAELAEALGWTLADVHRCIAAVGGGGLRANDVPVDEWEDGRPPEDHEDFGIDEDGDPMHRLQMRERLQALSRAYHELADRERYVMEALYDHDVPCRDVGRTLGVTESRVSQIHREVVDKLRRQLHAS